MYFQMPEPELLVKQLHGIAVCDTDDVTTKNWHGLYITYGHKTT